MTKNGKLSFSSQPKRRFKPKMKLYRICDELEIKRRSPHKERKTYISTLINNGADIDYVRFQARHKDLNTTLKSYVYSTTEKEKKVALPNNLF